MKLWLAVAGISGAMTVALGAFGAHGLKARLSIEAMGWWQTAVQYQMFHTLALALLALLGLRMSHSLLGAAAWAFLAGMLIFSGTLYAMALGAPRWFGAITPIGGLALILGWLLLAAYAIGIGSD